MDAGLIKGSVQGLRNAKGIIASLVNLKIETLTIDQINQAVKEVAQAQDTLFQLREELFRLQDENRDLMSKVDESEEWECKKSKYELVQTDGNAVVYQSKEGIPHYACPTCLERKEIQILQDRRVHSGIFDCPGCDKSFPINPAKPIQPIVRNRLSRN